MMRKLHGLFAMLCITLYASAQPTFPVNGVAEPREGCYAFTNATIVKDAQTTLQNAAMVIRDGKIVAVGAGIAIPKDAVVIDCKNKFIYPSFIDIYSDYGITVPQRQLTGFDFRAPAQITSSTKGAYGWNQAIKPEVQASSMFAVDDAKAKALRESGFGTVLTHQKDGIARGTGLVVTLASEKENMVIVKEKASAHYSFSKGTSGQSYPGSMMGCIALLRQTYIDAAWYKNKPATEGTNMSLQAWNDNQSLPQIFDVVERGNADQTTKWNALRADRIAKEFGTQYIIKASGYEYQRINEMAATKASFILPINYPQAMDVEDPADARFVSLSDMKHWEMAPGNPAAFEKAGINFCLTTSDLRDPKQFMANLRKAFDYGLSETRAMEALTKTPATLLGVYDKVGSLDAGKLANFLITSGPVFGEKTTVYQNWVQGDKYAVKEEGWNNIAGTYNLVISSAAGSTKYSLDVKSFNDANVIGKDTLASKFSFDGKMVRLSFSPVASRGRRRPGMGDSTLRMTVDNSQVHIGGHDTSRMKLPPDGMQGTVGDSMAMRPGRGGRNIMVGAPLAGPNIRLSGINNGDVWQGTGMDTSGNKLTWSATFEKAAVAKVDSVKKKEPLKLGAVTYPFNGYGWEAMPKAENLLIKNATVWTNEADGKMENTDVLVKNGKIAAVGKNLSDAGAKVIDGTGKHLTPGIIDEHSHIAASSINEGGQSVTSEVRIGDNLNPDDINIYRQLSGGVTSSHILHGSANTIGGQTQLIKLRWGVDDEGLKFKGADPFIKFALGENVKRTTAVTGNTRFPDTRMGVEEVLADAFQRATDYQAAMKGANGKSVRRDLELDALVEILNKKRFITCHSYVQSEITALMRVGDRYKFQVNTFTHILEGYKVADKMKAEGINASTFSDWWYYKMEVQDAIPYNAAIMTKVGLNVAINSDDAEMARRLNQEAAKSVKYGGLTEDQALKMVTLNPAKMLHVSDKVGSIKVGKDADLVLWSDNPLSIYAIAQKTIVDGIVYFDRDRDLELRRKITEERNRISQKMMGEKKAGFPMAPATPSMEIMNTCNDHSHQHGLLIIDGDDLK
ncbi:MAG: amidohydrolase family protein [Chitinophagaceae bacterium]